MHIESGDWPPATFCNIHQYGWNLPETTLGTLHTPSSVLYSHPDKLLESQKKKMPILGVHFCQRLGSAAAQFQAAVTRRHQAMHDSASPRCVISSFRGTTCGGCWNSSACVSTIRELSDATPLESSAKGWPIHLRGRNELATHYQTAETFHVRRKETTPERRVHRIGRTNASRRHF